MVRRMVIEKYIYLIYDLICFDIKSYINGSTILLDDWIKRGIFIFIDWLGVLLLIFALLLIYYFIDVTVINTYSKRTVGALGLYNRINNV